MKTFIQSFTKHLVLYLGMGVLCASFVYFGTNGFTLIKIAAEKNQFVTLLCALLDVLMAIISASMMFDLPKFVNSMFDDN